MKNRIPQLTDDEYHRQLKKQKGRCWLCPRKPTSRRLHGDHSHVTGKRRALLCWICNCKVIGVIEKFKIDPKKIVAYFKAFPH